MFHILLTNDDGYDAVGFSALIEALKPIAKLTVVAPALNKSACGHSLTLDKPLRVVCVEEDFYKIDDGTPSDCIFISLNNLFEQKGRPDLVISGINIGANMGEDITYSGTVAGAMEAVLQGVSAISISQVCKDNCSKIKNDWDFALAKKIIVDIVQKIKSGKFPLGKRKLLNINVPPVSIQQCKGIKITKAGYREYGNDTHKHYNPRGEEYYWIGLHPLVWQSSDDKSCDFEAVDDNFVSITPVKLDMTSYDDIEKLKQWI